MRGSRWAGRSAAAYTLGVVALLVSACAPFADEAPTTAPSTGYPWHTDIVATTFWVGESFDPTAADGSQRTSAYDSRWMDSYGGCDGLTVATSKGARCDTEERTAANDYFPTSMTPLQNPFYLDLPFDDLNNADTFEMRGEVVPWATDPPYAQIVGDRTRSLMKNRWVVLRTASAVCYGQIEDAGPGVYDDAEYVFGDDDQRPANTRFNGAGLDVSPALNGCLGFAELNGQNDRVDWAFVDDADVPDGPWRRIVTTSPARG